ncbi:MAG: hypothetical protein M3010_03430 [Candidatus Dormibacteraeota bacterium]|nr:hypothetical protein [Candidatus Dormibacteraeota bacterium]
MPAPDAPFPSVKVGDLPVTLATGEELRAGVQQRTDEAGRLVASASRLRMDAIAVLVEAGMILVARAGEWASGEPAVAAQLADATRAIKLIDDHDGGAPSAAARPRLGLSGILGRGRKASAETSQSRQAREERGAGLRVILAELGRTHGARLPAVAAAQARAIQLEQQASADLERARALDAEAAPMAAEAEQREASIAAMGFDAVYTAARLALDPPAPIDSPLALRGTEKAYLVEVAELARQKAAATPASLAEGLAFPVAQTGIPYRVGTYRARAIPQASLARLGSGVIVVTDQRLGFVGDLKSFSFALDTVVAVEQSRDGLTLLREGRDHADVLLTPAASRVLFYVNWVMQPRSSSTPRRKRSPKK